MRNPLASPTTLGVASGANLALMATTLLAPGLLVWGREWVALTGGGLAVFITGSIVSVVGIIGIIGFIGLAAPNIVRLAGARRLGERLLWGTLLGAVLLATTDLLLQQFSGMVSTLIPTGAVTGALGAPLLMGRPGPMRREKTAAA